MNNKYQVGQVVFFRNEETIRCGKIQTIDFRPSGCQYFILGCSFYWVAESNLYLDYESVPKL